MNRLRVAAWAAVAGLSLVSGCQSSRNDCCEEQGGLFRGGLLSRLGLRKKQSNGVVLPGTVVGAPVHGVPLSGESYGTPIHQGPILDGPPLTGPGLLPAPTPLDKGAPPLAPVPNGLADPVPAPPSTMSRRRN